MSKSALKAAAATVDTEAGPAGPERSEARAALAEALKRLQDARDAVAAEAETVQACDERSSAAFVAQRQAEGDLVYAQVLNQVAPAAMHSDELDRIMREREGADFLRLDQAQSALAQAQGEVASARRALEQHRELLKGLERSASYRASDARDAAHRALAADPAVTALVDHAQRCVLASLDAERVVQMLQNLGVFAANPLVDVHSRRLQYVGPLAMAWTEAMQRLATDSDASLPVPGDAR